MYAKLSIFLTGENFRFDQGQWEWNSTFEILYTWWLEKNVPIASGFSDAGHYGGCLECSLSFGPERIPTPGQLAIMYLYRDMSANHLNIYIPLHPNYASPQF